MQIKNNNICASFFFFSVSFAFGTDHLAIFSSSLSGWYFFYSRVYQAQLDLNAELFHTSEIPLFKIVFFKRFSISRRQTFEIPLRVLQALTVDMSHALR